MQKSKVASNELIDQRNALKEKIEHEERARNDVINAQKFVLHVRQALIRANLFNKSWHKILRLFVAAKQIVISSENVHNIAVNRRNKQLSKVIEANQRLRKAEKTEQEESKALVQALFVLEAAKNIHKQNQNEYEQVQKAFMKGMNAFINTISAAENARWKQKESNRETDSLKDTAKKALIS